MGGIFDHLWGNLGEWDGFGEKRGGGEAQSYKVFLRRSIFSLRLRVSAF